MKIKTIVDFSPGDFDNQVNEMLEQGYNLEKRELIPTPPGHKDYFYAEMVQLDPVLETEPVAVDPWELARQLKAFCDSVPKAACVAKECPLLPLCDMMLQNKAIDEWEV